MRVQNIKKVKREGLDRYGQLKRVKGVCVLLSAQGRLTHQEPGEIDSTQRELSSHPNFMSDYIIKN